jgi:hypothetical protein
MMALLWVKSFLNRRSIAARVSAWTSDIEALGVAKKISQEANHLSIAKPNQFWWLAT